MKGVQNQTANVGGVAFRGEKFGSGLGGGGEGKKEKKIE